MGIFWGGTQIFRAVLVNKVYLVSKNNLFWRRVAFKYNTFITYEPTKVSAKAFLVNLAPLKPKNFPLAPIMVVPHEATKYSQISL